SVGRSGDIKPHLDLRYAAATVDHVLDQNVRGIGSRCPGALSVPSPTSMLITLLFATCERRAPSPDAATFGPILQRSNSIGSRFRATRKPCPEPRTLGLIRDSSLLASRPIRDSKYMSMASKWYRARSSCSAQHTKGIFVSFHLVDRAPLLSRMRMLRLPARP